VTDAPAEIRELADRRAQARAARDFALADQLREDIAAAGWVVRDAAGGYALEPKPAYDVLPEVGGLAALSPRGQRHGAVVTLLVEGWPDDVRACFDALLTHLPADVGVVALDLGNVDGAGDAAEDYASAHDAVDVVHVSTATLFGAAHAALLRYDEAPVHVWMETSTLLQGDAITPLLSALDEPSVVAAGWRGADVDDDWRSFHDAGPGRVDALLGYLFAVRRDAALAVADADGSPFRSARFYRNFDLDFSFWLREAGGELVVVPDLPVQQSRHRGYHDTDPAYRDRESRRNYDHFLAKFRPR
jgi:hypothetical protein